MFLRNSFIGQYIRKKYYQVILVTQEIIENNHYTEHKLSSINHSNKLSMKKHVNEKKQEKERNKSQHSLLSHLFLSLTSVLYGNSRELKGTHSRDLKEALVEEVEGKKHKKRGKKGEILQIRKEKRKHKSPLRAFNKLRTC